MPHRSSWLPSLSGMVSASKIVSGIKHVSLPTSNVQRHIRTPLATFQFPLHRFDQINVDRTGLLPPSSRCTHLMTMVNRFTRWPEAIPLLDTTVPTCATALVTHWISHFGVPMECRLTSGHSSYHKFGHHFTVVGHQAPSFYILPPWVQWSHWVCHRHMKSAMGACLTSPNWINELPWVYWESGQLTRRTLAVVHQNWIMLSLSLSLGISLPTIPPVSSFSAWGTGYAHLSRFLSLDMSQHRYVFQPTSCVPSLYSFVTQAIIYLCRAPTKVP